MLTADDDVVGGSREGLVLVPRHTPETEIETRVTFDANISDILLARRVRAQFCELRKLGSDLHRKDDKGAMTPRLFIKPDIRTF
jgi:hypothetical protein